jgi:hypothetical protein
MWLRFRHRGHGLLMVSTHSHEQLWASILRTRPRMNLPFSWLGAGIAASPLAFQAIGQATKATSQLFGDLLSANETQKTNGLSEPIASKQQKQPNNSHKTSLAEIRNSIANWIENASKQLGLNQRASEFTLEVNEGSIVIDGPEPVRSQLAEYLHSSPDTVSGIIESVKQTESPLRWLPGAQNVAPSGTPFRMTLG